MNAAVDNVLMYSPSGELVETSRLERSNVVKFKTGKEIAEFCRTHNIVHELDTTSRVLPTPELKELFDKHYPIRRFPDIGLRAKGASTVIALESKNKDNPDSLHGHVMSAITGYVAKKLGADIDSVFVQADPELEYRKAFQPQLADPMIALLQDQGAAVISSCVEWNDLHLDFDHPPNSQYELFWHTTAFALSSAGNNGLYGPNGDIEVPTQKHMAFCHAPPLAVSVGAVEWGESTPELTEGFYIPGYSSANGPTFLAPVAPHAKVKWKNGVEPEAITGTSAAEPYAAADLAALNECFGPYLSREQILFAVIATCRKTVMVHKFGKQTPHDYSIMYKKNAAGHAFNDGPGGFGMIDAERAHHLLAHMVVLTQKNPKVITDPKIDPKEVRAEPPIPKNPEKFAAKDGFYYYDIELPAGYALKTTIEAQFTNAPSLDVSHGQIRMTSPSGTEIAMVTSRSYKHGVFNGESTTHGFTGEPTAGTWRMRSTQPISRLRISAHRFMEGDIIHQLDIEKLLAAPLPYIENAVPLVELKSSLRAVEKVAMQPRRPQLAAKGAEKMPHIPAVPQVAVAVM
ncbi:MAG: proprotein convertase P-domain-containing protein [Alphaproteobacteria bacterium]|nr:proprotein convertase P-domain-containing protein [Alphaproteobacteria bacterium]